ncbi:MAG: thioredoxin domain-containing protein [Bacteroidetes bacterium]|nr:thioredoxin domain-containing protein [Bacteroidota bacterium]
MAPTHSNKLIGESSPYLLQHAYNPVNWYPWGEEALQKAKDENKPILVSIGYAACHWCHVMERESFEDEATAAIMNEHFVNIKIDREERPDLDHIYMDAVQAMTGSGGWPLNVFLTPEGKPFYGGTYFPPQRAYNRPSWKETLHNVAQAFRERRHEIDAQAENLTAHIRDSNAFGTEAPGEKNYCTAENATEVVNNLLKSADTTWGGFGSAPKFPQTFSIVYLLRFAHTFQTSNPDLAFAAKEQAFLSLNKMIEGGIYDQIGGGFARYATDTEWLAPHFEKMLYDNALLVIALCEAYQLCHNERYREVIIETMDFVQRELMHPNKGFYAALDADSEGVEGKFYTWTKKEVEDILGEQAALYCEYYDVTDAGNWEHVSILRVKKPLYPFASERNLDPVALGTLLKECSATLLSHRSKRIRPLTDDKVLLGWNALMNTASSRAWAATGREDYRQLALANMDCILRVFATGNGEAMYHTWKNDQARYPAFLDDYAYLAEALLALHEITADTGWLLKAKEIAAYVIAEFGEEETGFFYYTGAGQGDVIVRKKEIYDGAIPSGNSVMAANLSRLALLLGDQEGEGGWQQRSLRMLNTMGRAITRYPSSFGNWADLLLQNTLGVNEIAITGKGWQGVHQEIMGAYIPYKVLMATEKETSDWLLLAGKPEMGKPAIYLCRNYTCQAPVFSAKDLISLINRPPKGN